MLRIANNLEYAAGFFQPSVLLGLGIAVLLFGLVIWLSGMALRKLFLILAGAVVGGLCGFYVIGRKIISTIGLAALAAFVSVVFDRIFVTLFAAALAIVIALAVMTWQYPDVMVVHTDVAVEEHQNLPLLSVRETFESLYSYALEFTDHIKQTYNQIPSQQLLIIPVLLVIFIAAGIFFWSITCAWCWATLGTMLIFAGMILLLLYKGSMPISSIIRNGPFFSGVFLLLMVSGTAAQLLLFRNAKGIFRKKSKTEASEEKPQDWRGL